jgi:O-antigen ligase
VILATILLGLSFTAIITGVVELPESRITALADLKQDNSSNERDRMARDGMEKIFESPLTGAYGEYEEGGYIHNIMSVWQETGFLGALFFLFMLGVPVAKLISAIIAEQSSHKDNVAISILLTAILLLIAGKYFTYLLVPAALAAYSCLNKNRYPLASDNKI